MNEKTKNVCLQKRSKTLELFTCYMAFHASFQGQKHISELHKGKELILQRETENPHDDYAVAVYDNDTKIGYVPSDFNILISRIIDKEIQIKAKTHTIEKGRILISISMEY
jgi:hypothetical protein